MYILLCKKKKKKTYFFGIIMDSFQLLTNSSKFNL